MERPVADLPLHGGKAPAWLMEKMVRLLEVFLQVLVMERGERWTLERLSDPCWFQALGAFLGFDWHSSGVTTTVCGALKQAGRKLEKEIGLYFFGGKGKSALRTKEELKRCEVYGLEAEAFINISRLTAKIDNACVQDGYSLYHHFFILTSGGDWGVIQQGMDEKTRRARRYHWYSGDVVAFTQDPHSGIVGEKRRDTLNLVGSENQKIQQATLAFLKEKPHLIEKALSRSLSLPQRHPVLFEDIAPQRLRQVTLALYESHIETFQDLICVQGVGAKTLRALSLASSLLYDEPLHFKDPARFSFAHGGKDGTPYPVNLETYEETIAILEQGVKKSKLSWREKENFFQRLKQLSLLASGTEGGGISYYLR